MLSPIRAALIMMSLHISRTVNKKSKLLFFVSENTPHVGSRTLRNQPQTDQGSFLLLLSFHSVERCYTGHQGCKSLMVLPTSRPCILQYQLARQYMPTVRIIVWLLPIWPTAFWLDLGPDPQEANHAWYWKPGQKFMDVKVKDPRRKFTTVALLNGHVVNLPYKYLCLYP